GQLRRRDEQGRRDQPARDGVRRPRPRPGAADRHRAGPVRHRRGGRRADREPRARHRGDLARDGRARPLGAAAPTPRVHDVSSARLAAAVGLAAGLLVACATTAPVAQPGGAVATRPPGVPTAAASTAPDTGCGDPTASLRPQGPLAPAGAFPAASFMRTVYQRGRLVVGVPQDTLLFSYRNPNTRQLEGFDVDV